MLRRSFLFGLSFLLPTFVKQHNSWAQPKQHRHLEFEKAEQFIKMVEELLKQGDWEKNIQGEKGENKYDAVAFCYELAIYHEEEPLGAHTERTRFWTEAYGLVWGLLRYGVPMSPKTSPEERQKAIQDVRPALIQGSYRRILVSLCLKRKLVTITQEQIEKEDFPPIKDIIDLDSLRSGLERMRK